MDFEGITHQTTGSNRQGIAAYSQETISASNAATAKDEGTFLYGLTPGKVFAGEIVALQKDRVMLKLDSGETIQASLNSQVELEEGQLLAFMVKSNNKKQLAIKPLFDVVINNSSVLKALENAGVPVNAKNSQLINLLMMEQMPIDKETVTSFMRKMTLYPDTKIDTLVDLKKMGLFLSQENIEKFEEFQNNGYRLSEDLSLVSEEITEYLAGSAKEEGTRLLTDFRTISDLFLSSSSQKTVSPNGASRETADGLQGSFRSEKIQVLTPSAAGLAPETLTNVQQEQMEQLEATWSRFEGQGVEMEQLVDGLKVLNDQAEILLKELQEHLNLSEETENQAHQAVTDNLTTDKSTSGMASPELLSKIYSAFEKYEAGERLEAKWQQQNSEQPRLIVENSKLNIPKQTAFSQEAVGAVLGEAERGNLAQKVYRLTEDVSQYFAIRSGHLKSEQLVSMLRDMIPAELSQVEPFEHKDAKQETQSPGTQEGASSQQRVHKSFMGAQELRNQVAIDARTESVKDGKLLQPESETPVREKEILSQQNQNEKNTIYEEKSHQVVENKYAYDKILEKLSEFKDVIQGKEFQKVFRRVLEDKMSISSQELSKEKVKEFFESLSQRLDKYTKIAEANVNASENIVKNTQSLKQNVEYINQLNQLYSYVQIPLKLSGQTVNSELYVMTNKKRRREANEAFTALLHLDMPRLGPIDIFITMEGKRVATRFYLADEDTAKYMRGKSKVFMDKLQKSGFQITAEFEKKPESTKVVEEFIRQGKEANMEGEYSFDIRM